MTRSQKPGIVSKNGRHQGGHPQLLPAAGVKISERDDEMETNGTQDNDKSQKKPDDVSDSLGCEKAASESTPESQRARAFFHRNRVPLRDTVSMLKSTTPPGTTPLAITSTDPHLVERISRNGQQDMQTGP